jgi:hypothetical protein
MAKTPIQLQDLNDAIGNAAGSLVELSTIAVPFTTISNRAPCTDMSKDGLPRMGTDRFIIQRITEVQDEYVSNGDRIWRPANDPNNQFRFVGNWSLVSGNDGFGAISSTIGDYIEVTWYGTDLNITMANLTSDRGFQVFVDGVNNNTFTTVTNGALGARGTTSYQLLVVATGLTQGLHTARLVKTTAAAGAVTGFEFVNTNTNLVTTAGSSIFMKGQRTYLNATDSQAYNTTFESGTLGTRGGRVLVYAQDGEIKKAVTPTDASSTTWTSTNHANEELYRSYFFREFGNGRADDFSRLLPGSASYAYTLDDNVTTLSASLAGEINGGLNIASGGSVAFTFVGTGVDLVEIAGGAITTTYDVLIDGSTIATGVALGTNTNRVIKLAAGLPYGTHVLRINRTSAGNSTNFGYFNVYRPKKPTLPADATQIAE